MPSRTSKPPSPQARSKRDIISSELRFDEAEISEERLTVLAGELSNLLGPRDLVLLEGAMGVGKSTFARAMLSALGVEQTPEGSPTFAIAHEYVTMRGAEVIHIDFYRFRSDEEIEESGAHEYFWHRPAVVLAEWTSAFKNFRQDLFKSLPVSRSLWTVDLEFGNKPKTRSVKIANHFR